MNLYEFIGGSAAIHGLRGKENVECFILFPEGRVSPIQQLQMTSVKDDNVHCIAVQVLRHLLSDTRADILDRTPSTLRGSFGALLLGVATDVPVQRGDHLAGERQ